MGDLESLIARAKGPLALDEATIAFLSKAETLEAVERLEDAIHAFKALVARQFLDRLRQNVAAVAKASGGRWAPLEVSRVETYLGLKPAGDLMRFADDFWLVFAYSTSPGLPFAKPWFGLFTTPRAQAAIKRELHERVRGGYKNPKRDDAADWWVQWDWVPDWPDTARPRNLALLVGEGQDRILATIRAWLESQAPIVAEVLARESGEGWSG
ncbi:MAG: hypothetical protein FJX51_01785 [Alphaproteobacteria bacterium]|nr:hypothetical protein [Alphaproteobacteria bacterium]